MITFTVTGKAMSTISGSEIVLSPENYDGGSQGARDIFAAFKEAKIRHVGRGTQTELTTTIDGAWCLWNYLDTVGSGYMTETEWEIRAEGRTLLEARDRIEIAIVKGI